jgi:threonine/homoserine/homoserine lactone efflux protein
VVVEVYAFLITAFLLSITPGPSVLYVAAISLRFGTLAGIISALGVNVGSYVLILAAAFGLYPILQSFPLIVEIIQTIGGFYMIHLAIRMWPSKRLQLQKTPDNNGVDLRKLFVRGFITTMLNPKDILFYILFIPTFIDGSKHGTSFIYMFLILSFTYAFIGIATKSAIAIFSGKAKKLFASKEASVINYFSSFTLTGLGLFAISKAINNFM